MNAVEKDKSPATDAQGDDERDPIEGVAVEPPDGEEAGAESTDGAPDATEVAAVDADSGKSPPAEEGHLGEGPRQPELPFAVVDGEPLTKLPEDLYIPPDALEIFLEAFEGPLDLLLYLIRRQNIDILDIPIAEITKQYVQYIELMSELQLELAGEYLVMAAMLAEIKSRMLLPRPESDEEDEEDPRAELVRRLQEYERFKKAAQDISDLPRLERDVHIAQVEAPERKVVQKLPDVTLKELLLACSSQQLSVEVVGPTVVRADQASTGCCRLIGGLKGHAAVRAAVDEGPGFTPVGPAEQQRHAQQRDRHGLTGFQA